MATNYSGLYASCDDLGCHHRGTEPQRKLGRLSNFRGFSLWLRVSVVNLTIVLRSCAVLWQSVRDRVLQVLRVRRSLL